MHGDPVAGERSVAGGKGGVDVAVLARRLLECVARGARRQERGDASVAMDRADDRQPDLVPGRVHDDMVKAEVERPEPLVVVVRLVHPLEVLGESGELVLRQAAGSGHGHLALENDPDGDQGIEERHVVVVGQGDAEHERVEQIPGAPRLDGGAAPLLDAHEAAFLEHLQPFADDRSAEAELFAERGLGGQDVALGESSADDLLRELLDDERGEASGPPRRPAVGDGSARGAAACHAGHPMVGRSRHTRTVTYDHHMTAFAVRSKLGLGTAPLAGLFEAVSPDQARATVDRAWELGVRHFDTAPLYGSGLAEERLGAALAARPRDEYTISTKVGRVLVPGRPSSHFIGAPPLEAVFDYTPDGIRRSLAGSLERLQLERVDVVLLHDPEEHMGDTRRAVDVVRELAHWVGVGTNVAATAAELVARGEIDVVLLAGRYTLLDRTAADELLPLCAERGVPVLAAGVFNSGVLAGGSTFEYEDAADAILVRRRALETMCAPYDVPLAAAALQFPLRHPAVESVVVGARSAAEIEEDVRLLDVPVPDALWSEIDAAYATWSP